MTDYKLLEQLPTRLYTVGDLHGCLDELIVLLDFLERDEGLTKNDMVLFIGDYIDRGVNSKGVIDLLLEFRTRHPQTVFLKGNHEDMILSYMGFMGQMGEVWLHNGGVETLGSYNLGPNASPDDLREAMPRSHLEFFQTLERYMVTEQFVFVHAGLDPLRGLHTQIDDDLFWIRDVFIQNIHHFGKLVFFGHTPFQDVVFHYPYKIGLDTGLVFGNKLSCLEVMGQKVLQIKKDEREVEVFDFPEE